MYTLQPYRLTDIDKLTTEVEHRTTFTLNRCELNIFETHRQAEKVKLQFGGFTITSMLMGKKVIHDKDHAFAYLPGQTLMVHEREDMVIDFPDAQHQSPTQCTALVVETEYLKKQLDYINEQFPRDDETGGEWHLNPQLLFLQNDESITQLGNRLIRIFSGNDPLKDILIDIKLKELVLSILRLQNLKLATHVESGKQYVNDRFAAVIEYIRRNATGQMPIQDLCKMAYMSKSSFYRAFTNEFGISPHQMIMIEKINVAKTMLAMPEHTIKDVCFATGFSDPNYFSRAFKKQEGITPGEFRQRSLFESF